MQFFLGSLRAVCGECSCVVSLPIVLQSVKCVNMCNACVNKYVYMCKDVCIHLCMLCVLSLPIVGTFRMRVRGRVYVSARAYVHICRYEYVHTLVCL